MESVIVNARVSRAKKEAGAGILASLGSTTTELINGAYDYLIEHRSLPGASAESAPSREAFVRFVSCSTLEVDWDDRVASGDYRSLVREGKRADYESLA